LQEFALVLVLMATAVIAAYFYLKRRQRQDAVAGPDVQVERGAEPTDRNPGA